MATSLGVARGVQKPVDADDAVAQALSPGNGRRVVAKRYKRRRESFRRLPRLRPRERLWKTSLLALLALAVAVGCAATTFVLLPTTSPIVLPPRLEPWSPYVSAACVAMTLLVTFAVASLVAGSFAATLATLLFALALATGVAALPTPIALLATSAAALLILWLRNRHLVLGLLGGAAAGAAGGFFVEMLALPIVAMALAWPPRRPLVGTARVVPTVLVAGAAFLAVVALRSENLAMLRLLFDREALLAWPGMPTLPPMVLAAAAFGAAALVVRSLAAGLFIAAWAAVAWWSGGTVPLWPVVAAVVAVGLHAAGNAPPTPLRNLVRPLAVGGVVALVAWSLVPSRLPDPTPAIERDGLAAAVAAMVPDGESIRVPDADAAGALRRAGVAVSEDGAYLLADAVDRRRLGGTGDVLLRLHAIVDGRVTQWVLVGPPT